jgi:hypothetical protein
MLHWLSTSPQFDGRHIGHLTQEWYSTSTAAGTPALSWGRMGYDPPPSDNGAQQWRDVYWTFGQNLVDMNAKATAEQRWDLLGVGLILKAWGWQVLTDSHGEIIIKEAFNQGAKFDFAYDTQEFAYQEVVRLLDSAIVLLNRTDGAVDALYLGRGDKIYNGDRTKWLKFAHGLKAMNLNHYSNKASYNPAAVIAEVDLALASNADDALLTYPNTNNDDINFLGRTRNNHTLYRQTQFIVNLMNGNQFGGVVDPRMSRMLSPAPDGVFRGLDINQTGFGAITVAAQQPNNPMGYAGTGGIGLPGRYLFDDKAKNPIMTYAQLQFVKAEAAFRSGQTALARTAYQNAIGAHIDFVNARNLDAGQTPTQITAAERATFLASTVGNPATLTLSHIMSQKYIAQWAWGHNELFMDMRRYHWTDVDPLAGVQIFRGFTPPTNLYVDNGGALVQRIRPRYNSEYIWNSEALKPLGALEPNYHTVIMWIIQP